MAFIRFVEKNKAVATMAMMENNVPFTCYRGGIYAVPDYVLQELTQAGYSFEHSDPPADPSPNSSRVTVRLVNG